MNKMCFKGFFDTMIVLTKFHRRTTTGNVLNVEILWFNFLTKGFECDCFSSKRSSNIQNVIWRHDMAILLRAELVQAGIATFQVQQKMQIFGDVVKAPLSDHGRACDVKCSL